MSWYYPTCTAAHIVSARSETLKRRILGTRGFCPEWTITPGGVLVWCLWAHDPADPGDQRVHRASPHVWATPNVDQRQIDHQIARIEAGWCAAQTDGRTHACALRSGHRGDHDFSEVVPK